MLPPTPAVPDAVPQAYWQVEGDYAQSQWTDIAIEYIASGVAFKTKPVDPDAPDGAVEIMRAPTGDYIMTISKTWKDLAGAISQYLNATPNAVTPGVSIIEKWLKSFGELPDALRQPKLVEMTYEISIGKSATRPVTCIAVSRPFVSATLSTTDINVCSVFQELWNNGGNHVLADGRWVIPYSPVGDHTTNADFAAHVASLQHDDALVLDPEHVYRIENLTGTDTGTKFYHDKATQMIAGRNNVRLGATSLAKCVDALVVKQTNFRGEEYTAIEFKTATQVVAMKPLPKTNPTRPASAVAHPTERGVYCTAMTWASAAVINPAFVAKATEKLGAATQALDPKMVEALDGYYQAMGPGDTEYLEKMAASGIGWPLAVSPNRDKTFVEIPVSRPAECGGISLPDPNYSQGADDPDIWVPEHAAKEDMTQTVRPVPPHSPRSRPASLTPPARPPASASTSTTPATSRRPTSRRGQTWAPSSTATSGGKRLIAGSCSGGSYRRGSGTISRQTRSRWATAPVWTRSVTTTTVQARGGTAAARKSTANGRNRSRRPGRVLPRNGRARPRRGRGGSGSGRESRGLPQY